MPALDELRASDRFRFANRLRAWVEVEDGQIVDHGFAGAGLMGATTLDLGVTEVTLQAVALPDRRLAPEVGDGWVRFTQTTGGRTGVPLPRTVKHPPFVQYRAPLVWTTLQLTIRADGTCVGQLLGASGFPRHWIYGDDGALTGKTGLTDYKDWYRHAFGKRTPWGELDSPALVTAVETALERELSSVIMRGGERPEIRKLKAGKLLVEQGAPGAELFLLLDGVLSVEVDGEPIAELGPGAVLGERAVLEGGQRTSSLRAVTACRVAVAAAEQLDLDHLVAAGGGSSPGRSPRSLMRLHLCGVRGSTPAVGHAFAGVGGHTSCVAIAHDDAEVPTLVLDAGTGLRRLTTLLDGEPFRGTILLGHLHWDHTQGLPFFAAGDRPDAEVRLLIPAQDADPLELLSRGMGPPHFPITPAGLRGTWTFGDLEEGTHDLAGFDVLALEIPHPGGRAFGYRVSDGRTSMAYLSDHGPIALGPGPEGWGPYHDAALALADGVDVLLHDARVHRRGAAGAGDVRALGGRVRGAAGPAGRRPPGGPVPPRSVAHRRRGRGAGRAAPAHGVTPPRARHRGRNDPALIGEPHQSEPPEADRGSCRDGRVVSAGDGRGSTPHTAREEFGP